LLYYTCEIRGVKAIAVIPAYREEGRVGKVVAAAREYLADVLVVDDGSPDGTGAEAASAGASVLRLEPNRGKGAALLAGLQEARRRGFDVAVTLDADGQHDAAAIPAMLAALARGADIVIGTRMQDVHGMPPQRIFSNTFTSAVISVLAGRLVRDSQTGYRALRLAALERLPLVRRGFDLESEMLLKAARAGARIGHVPVPTIYGDERSKINVLADTYRFFRVVVADLAGRLER
jgi:glycosyltransferase involved in cell wall biosynthesis